MGTSALSGRAGRLTGLLLLLSVALAAETVTEDFATGLGPWQPLVPGNWTIQRDGDNSVAALAKRPVLREGVRRPADYLLLPAKRWRNVTLTARVKSLEPATAKGRDVVLIFGYQDDTHLYYAHFSNDADGKAHNIVMKVDGETRQTIQTPEKPEPKLTDGWHTIRVTHAADGAIAVFIDDLQTPLMTARDTTWPVGLVGVGTFNDRAQFDDLHVTGELVFD